MDDKFSPKEKLYRAVYPPNHPGMYWKRDGSLSSAAFADPKGLSVERGYHRENEEIIANMGKNFVGCIVSIKVEDCNETQAIVKYLPTKNNQYHSEIHGGEDKLLLDKRQRVYLAQKAQKEYMVVE